MIFARPLRTLLIGALLVSGGFLLEATTVKYLRPDDLIRGAHRIFHGTCSGTQSYRDTENRIVTRYTFTVHDTLKGTPDSLQSFTFYGGEYQGIHTVIPGLSHFRLGDEVVLFLGNIDPKSQLCFPVGLDQGLFRVVIRDGHKRVKRSLGGLQLVGPRVGRAARFPSHPDLDSFKRFVRERVAHLRQNR